MEYLESDSSTENSFLQETEYNSDINSDIRRQIDGKFEKSRTNSTYHFPRSLQPMPKTKIIIKPMFSKFKPGILPRKTLSLNSSVKFLKKSLPKIEHKSPQVGSINSTFKGHRKNMRSIDKIPNKFLKSPYVNSIFTLPRVKSTKISTKQ